MPCSPTHFRDSKGRLFQGYTADCRVPGKRGNMDTAQLDQPIASVKLDKILESALILGWKDLGQSPTEGMVQVEYHVGHERSVEYLKMWCANGRGYLSLVCDYSVNPGWSGGPRFVNGYHSRELGRLLEAIMMNQTMFHHASQAGSNVLVQVGPPTEEQVATATQCVAETFAKPANPPAKPRRQTARVPVGIAVPAVP